MEPWRRNLYVLWTIELAAFAGLSLILPFIPLYVRSLGITDPATVTRWSGLLLSGPFMVSFLVTPAWGTLGDRFGQKPMVVRALLGSAAAYVGMAMASSVEGLFAWRLALGAVSGFLAAGMALVAMTVPDNHRGYALGLLQSVIPAAGLIGPLFGGVLADLIGYRAIFLLIGVICAAGGIVAALTLREPRDRSRVPQRPSCCGQRARGLAPSGPPAGAADDSRLAGAGDVSRSSCSSWRRSGSNAACCRRQPGRCSPPPASRR